MLMCKMLSLNYYLMMGLLHCLFHHLHYYCSMYLILYYLYYYYLELYYYLYYYLDYYFVMMLLELSLDNKKHYMYFVSICHFYYRIKLYYSQFAKESSAVKSLLFPCCVNFKSYFPLTFFPSHRKSRRKQNLPSGPPKKICH